MKEELIISGRLNEAVDPTLHIWGWEIPLYLFLGGLAAGVLFFAGLFYLQGKENEYKAAVKWAPIFTPIFLILGLGALFLDLHHKAYFWQLYTNINFQSPMSWGAWTLMVVTPLSVIWSATYIQDILPNWDWKFSWVKNIISFFQSKRKEMAWLLVFFSVILGIYTGILLSAFNSRPLWNTSILGPLFLTSGLSAGAALIMMMSRNSLERRLFSKLDLVLIALELFFVIHLFMGFMASTQVQIEAAEMFLGGPYTLPFWIFVVILGMVIPAFLEWLELKGHHIPAYLPAVMILFGNIMLRFIITYAGQASRYLY